ncbi:MAG TPA: hemolysin family protein [Vicinamibacteria bacterium]|nr:hemolysin family protein [Vicinamibacteria bacterium]
MTLAFLLAALVVVILLNGVFAGSEIAIISASKARVQALAKEGHKAAAVLKGLHDDPERFLATVQIGVTLMATLAGMLGGYLASLYVEPALLSAGLGRWVGPTVVATVVVTAAIVYVELILGELVPKALALRFADFLALVAARPLNVLARITHPVVVLLTASTRAILRLMGIKKHDQRTFVSEEEILHLVTAGRAQGVLNQSELELIHSIFEFSDTPVRKVMVPRPKIFALEAETPPGEVEQLMVDGGFSRIPVFQESIDNVVGVVYIKDALRQLQKRQPIVLRKMLHPIHFVPETRKVGELLKDLQKRRTHMAMVIDEHGSVTGLVTLEDLLEEIVGEIQDEYDWEERPVERLGDGSLVLDGTMAVAEVREAHGIPIPESAEFESVAGFMLDRLGSVPRGGETVVLGDYRLTVVDVERNRISKVKIERLPAKVKRPPRTILKA